MLKKGIYNNEAICMYMQLFWNISVYLKHHFNDKNLHFTDTIFKWRWPFYLQEDVHHRLRSSPPPDERRAAKDEVPPRFSPLQRVWVKEPDDSIVPWCRHSNADPCPVFLLLSDEYHQELRCPDCTKKQVTVCYLHRFKGKIIYSL